MTIVDLVKREYETISKELKTERDDIDVRLHLLGMDAKDEWTELEKKYDRFRHKITNASTVAGNSAEDITEAIKSLGDELRKGYRRIRDSL